MDFLFVLTVIVPRLTIDVAQDFGLRVATTRAPWTAVCRAHKVLRLTAGWRRGWGDDDAGRRWRRFAYSRVGTDLGPWAAATEGRYDLSASLVMILDILHIIRGSGDLTKRK